MRGQHPIGERKYVRCLCGKECKGRAAHANHARKCPIESARSAAFVAAVQRGEKPPTDAEFLAQYRQQEDAAEAKRAARERSNANLALTNGRPSLSGDGTTSPTVQTRVPQWVKDALIAEAAELGYKTARSDGDGKLAQQVLIEHARRYLASQPIEKGSRVVLSRGLSVGPKAGALGTVRRLAGPDGLVRVHFDTDPDHRTYGVPAADLARKL
ncbi:hypothetical protein [Mycobacteroides abscessus]|uniref:hypothetical protein n=1 Tax=Mycobacteroides abscessus TaxID=36809 RepID=UPI001F15B080|nr:hypothetical protein [Mycobacteroides abscessus]